MTLFTLAGALISASHVCCVVLLSAYQQTTSAAVHNRSFEGFFSSAKKELERVRTTTTKREGENGGENTAVHKRIQLLFQTHRNGHDGWSFHSLLLLCSSDFLSLGLIRLLVEMQGIGEDSWTNQESVCAVIALIKRVVLLLAKNRKERAWQWKGLGLFFALTASSLWKEHLLSNKAFVNWDDF